MEVESGRGLGRQRPRGEELSTQKGSGVSQVLGVVRAANIVPGCSNKRVASRTRGGRSSLGRAQVSSPWMGCLLLAAHGAGPAVKVMQVTVRKFFLKA